MAYPITVPQFVKGCYRAVLKFWQPKRSKRWTETYFVSASELIAGLTIDALPVAVPNIDDLISTRLFILSGDCVMTSASITDTRATNASNPQFGAPRQAGLLDTEVSVAEFSDVAGRCVVFKKTNALGRVGYSRAFGVRESHIDLDEFAYITEAAAYNPGTHTRDMTAGEDPDQAWLDFMDVLLKDTFSGQKIGKNKYRICNWTNVVYKKVDSAHKNSPLFQ